MEFANRRFFERHDSLLIARGASPRATIVAADGSILGWITNGGIRQPMRTELQPGTRLVRFGGTSGDGSRGAGLPHLVAAGAWWLDFTEYRRVEAFATQRGLPVTVALRILCCVPLEWSAMDMVVQVRLKGALLAWGGVGAPAIVRDAASKTSEVLDGLEANVRPPISQLCIPGLGSGDVQREAVMFEGYGHLPPEQSRLGYIIRTV